MRPRTTSTMPCKKRQSELLLRPSSLLLSREDAADASDLIIYRASKGLYVEHYSDEHGNYWLTEGTSSSTVELEIEGVVATYPANVIVSEKNVRQAAHFFLQNEQMDPSLDWVEVYAPDE